MAKDKKDAIPIFLTWDYKESPGEVLDDLAPVLKKFGVILQQHDTGGDS